MTVITIIVILELFVVMISIMRKKMMKKGLALLHFLNLKRLNHILNHIRLNRIRKVQGILPHSLVTQVIITPVILVLRVVTRVVVILATQVIPRAVTLTHPRILIRIQDILVILTNNHNLLSLQGGTTVILYRIFSIDYLSSKNEGFAWWEITLKC